MIDASSSLLAVVGLTRVSRGDWLRNAANFRRPAFCFDFDVERRSHVTMKVHKFSICRTIYLCFPARHNLLKSNLVKLESNTLDDKILL